MGVCEDVQRGLASKSYDTGRYSVRREIGVHHFHKYLAKELRAAVKADAGSRRPGSKPITARRTRGASAESPPCGSGLGSREGEAKSAPHQPLRVLEERHEAEIHMQLLVTVKKG